jgi:Uracil-DNA glycosylase
MSTDVNKSLSDAINYVDDYVVDIQKIPDCQLCSLKGDDYAFPRIVRGSGPKVMIVGEAPGREEAKQHLSFVGRSGKGTGYLAISHESPELLYHQCRETQAICYG